MLTIKVKESEMLRVPFIFMRDNGDKKNSIIYYLHHNNLNSSKTISFGKRTPTGHLINVQSFFRCKVMSN